ncbi:MAG TPA: prephenate dehydrogenase/arogenate dehydrogenase family protein, partial [Thermoleophilaceae bacterium]
LIGGSIGLAARGEGHEVTGWDPDPGALERATGSGALSRAAASVEEAAGVADIVFACAPVSALPGLVRQALGAAGPQTLVTDVGSTKRAIASIDDERFVGGHPIAGAETAGVENARATLFHGATWYLTPSERSSGVLYERLHSLLARLGARPVAIDAEAHDRLLAAVSHLPHVIANVLVSQVAARLRDQGEGLPRVGPSFRDVTRVAGANSAIWTDIYVSNADAIADEIEALARGLGEVAGSLRDREAMAEWNERAAEDRRALLEADLAGGPVHELQVSVPNRPGIVAQVALALGRGGVNIADMALAPAPDNRSGAITLWITGDGAGARAAELIESLGFPVADVG